MTATREAAGPAELRGFEALAAQFDVGAMGGLYRVVIGACVFPLQTALVGRDSGWGVLIAAFLLALVLIRFVPLISRRLLRFSPEVREIWTARRQLAKHYDSFQWRKLFWIGAGMAISLGVVAERPLPCILLCAGCLAAGLAGMWRWHAVRPRP